LAVFQPKRWDSLLQQRLSEAIDLGLEQEFVKEFFEKIHAESVRVQMNAKG
jgi:chorismate mutase